MSLRITSMPNFRDAGGHRTFDGGSMRTGLLYRSDQIGPLKPGDADALHGLGIRVVYDLRTEAERAMFPGERIPGATHVPVDVLADDRQAGPAQLLRLLAHPRAAEAMLGNGQAAALFMQGYQSVVRLPSAQAGFGRVYAGLLGDAQLPALMHCTSGKDRTGWACAALQTLLGVSYEDVLTDFLESNRYVPRKYQPQIDEFVARGGNAQLLAPVIGVNPAYLEASFEEVRKTYGSIESYFAAGLGIDARTQQALRERFVAPKDSGANRQTP